MIHNLELRPDAVLQRLLSGLDRAQLCCHPVHNLTILLSKRHRSV